MIGSPAEEKEMDPAKALAAVAKALGLPDGASDDDIRAALDATVLLRGAQAGTAEEPADEPAEEPAVEASAKVALEGGTDEAAPDEAAEDALAGELRAVLALIAEASGLDEAGVLAALRDRAGDVGAMLSGMPESGTAAGDQALAKSASEEVAKALSAKIGARDAEIAKLQKQVSELGHADDMRQLESAVQAGHILEASKPVFAALAAANRVEFRKQLQAASKTPAVPTGTIVSGGAPAENIVTTKMGTASFSSDELRRSLKRMGVKWSDDQINEYAKKAGARSA